MQKYILNVVLCLLLMNGFFCITGGRCLFRAGLYSEEPGLRCGGIFYLACDKTAFLPSILGGTFVRHGMVVSVSGHKIFLLECIRRYKLCRRNYHRYRRCGGIYGSAVYL